MISPAGKALSAALERPDEWELKSRHRMRHVPSNTSWWIANGALFFDGDELEDTPKCLGLIERHPLFWKAKRMANVLTARKLLADPIPQASVPESKA